MLRELATTPISEILTKPCITLPASATVFHAITAMKTNRQGAVVTVDTTGKTAGMFTERDVLLASRSGDREWSSRPLHYFHTVSPVTIRSSETVASALAKMQDGRFRHIAAVDSDDIPILMLSIRDILTHVAEKFQQEFVNLPPEPRLEARSLWGG